jgi:lysozyme
MITNITDQLRRDESEVLHAYPDSLGYLTIGVGRLIDVRKNGGISKDESAYLLNNDIRRTTTDLAKALPWASTLDPVRFAVLINMAFNMGVDGLLEFHNTLASVQAGNYDAAANGMLNSKWARQVGARATRLAQQMRTGEWV